MSSNTRPPGKPGDSPFNRTAQHDAKRNAILSQAAKLFNGRGFRATTLLDIAESLGLTKTSLYYYVKTKEDLIYQCYRVALQHYHAVLDEIERLDLVRHTADVGDRLTSELKKRVPLHEPIGDARGFGLFLGCRRLLGGASEVVKDAP